MKEIMPNCHSLTFNDLNDLIPSPEPKRQKGQAKILKTTYEIKLKG